MDQKRIASTHIESLAQSIPTSSMMGGCSVPLPRMENCPKKKRIPRVFEFFRRILPHVHSVRAPSWTSLLILPNPSSNNHISSSFDDFTNISVTITDMLTFIQKPPVPLSTATKNNHLLPDFLQMKKKITYEHGGQYQQGYVGQRDDICRFVYKCHANCKEEEWGVPLPDLTHNWSSICVEGVLLP